MDPISCIASSLNCFARTQLLSTHEIGVFLPPTQFDTPCRGPATETVSIWTIRPGEVLRVFAQSRGMPRNALWLTRPRQRDNQDAVHHDVKHCPGLEPPTHRISSVSRSIAPSSISSKGCLTAGRLPAPVMNAGRKHCASKELRPILALRYAALALRMLRHAPGGHDPVSGAFVIMLSSLTAELLRDKRYSPSR